MQRHTIRTVAAAIAATALLTACGTDTSTPTLTDAETVWCSSEPGLSSMVLAGHALELFDLSPEVKEILARNAAGEPISLEDFLTPNKKQELKANTALYDFLHDEASRNRACKAAFAAR